MAKKFLRNLSWERIVALFLFCASDAFAMGGSPSSPSPSGPLGFLMSMLPFILIIVIFYVFMIRPQQKKQREKDQMLNSLKRGDRIVTAGGILGEVQQVKDNTVVVRIADNVKIELQRASVAARIGESEEGTDSR